MTGRLLLSLGGALLALVGTARAEPFTFVAIGDMPYTLPDDYPRFERLIGAINRLQPAFTLHIGDIKSGSTPCSDAMLQKNLDLFGTFEQPLIYTPGDNEWTDCHRKRAGELDPLERLAKLRSMYFTAPSSFGRSPMPVERQGDVMPAHAMFVENQRWSQEGVLFATVHVVGSNNGFERTVASVEEWFARDAANVAWIEDSFGKAAASGSPALVLGFQADPYWDRKLAERGGDDGFRNVLTALVKGAEAYGKPVLLVQGDSHMFIVDQPLIGSDAKTPLANVYRLQVMGANLVHGVAVTVDPVDAGVFAFRPLIVPENMVQARAN